MTPRASSGAANGAVPRLVTVWCPTWSLHAAGIGPDVPAAVVEANRVVVVSSPAREASVRPGLRRREAQARCPELLVVDHDPERDARRFEPVARAVAELVPTLEITEPGLLTFATRGPSRYVGGDDRLAERIRQIVGRFLGDHVTDVGAGHVVGDVPAVGIADGRFASGVAAHRSRSRGRPLVVPSGPAATAVFLAPVSVRALHEVGGVSVETVGLLRRLGLACLGDVAAIPVADLLARFGPEGAFVHALATGGDARPPGAHAPPPELLAVRILDDPVHHVEPLVFVAKQLAEELHRQVRDRGLVTTRLVVEAETDHGERSERTWYRPLGLTAAAMVERVRWQLEGWVHQPGGITAGVVMLRLAPSEVRGDAGRQLGFWGGQTQADEWAIRAIARVAGLLGEESVLVPTWQGARDPGAVYALVPAVTSDLDERPSASQQPTSSPPWPGRLPAPSPAQVLSCAVPCTVTDADGEPVDVGGRGLVSAPPATMRIGDATRSISIIAWAGPWPVEERWWDPDRARRRARFQLLLGDGRACLAAIEGRRWWIDAWYD
ncbi:MAG: DNA polymerase Y family protein [Acidimicrobiia bacterium]